MTQLQSIKNVQLHPRLKRLSDNELSAEHVRNSNGMKNTRKGEQG
jgi:hypothetical protein